MMKKGSYKSNAISLILISNQFEFNSYPIMETFKIQHMDLKMIFFP